MLNQSLLPVWLNGRLLLVLLPLMLPMVAVGALGAWRLLARPPRQAYLKPRRPGRAHWLP
jgi:hypothetical protein